MDDKRSALQLARSMSNTMKKKDRERDELEKSRTSAIKLERTRLQNFIGCVLSEFDKIDGISYFTNNGIYLLRKNDKTVIQAHVSWHKYDDPNSESRVELNKQCIFYTSPHTYDGREAVCDESQFVDIAAEIMARYV